MGVRFPVAVVEEIERVAILDAVTPSHIIRYGTMLYLMERKAETEGSTGV
jgi:hypothetical protein